MPKEPQMTRKNTCSGAYDSSRRADHKRGQSSPSNRGILAQIRRYQLNSSIYNLFEDLHKCFGSPKLRRLFREHASKPGALGRAIEWLQNDDMRVRRQPEATDLSEAWHNNRSHSGHAPEPINPYAQPDLTSDGWTDLDTTELHLPGWRPLARCSVADPPPFSPESFKGYPIDPQEMHTGAHTYQRRPITMPELSSRRQYSTEAASPPSSRGRECHGVSKQWQMSYQAKQVDYKAVLHLPPQGPDVHQDYGADRRYQQHWDGELQMYSRHATWPEESIENHAQGHMSHQGSTKSIRAAFWATIRSMAEPDYRGQRVEGARIPAHLKGKGKAMIHDPNEGGSMQEDQVFSGCGVPQHGSPANAFSRPRFMGTASYTDDESVCPGALIEVEPQAQNSFSTSQASTRPASQPPQRAHILAARPLPPSPIGKLDPYLPPAESIVAGLVSSSRQRQRKRKREVDAGDNKETGAEEPGGYKRPRKLRLEKLLGGWPRDAREGGGNEQGQPPAESQPRRSTRIQATNKKKGAAPPKTENPAKSAGRRRAGRKK